jgi:hypothetical protein
MKHRIHHSFDLKERLADYAARLQVGVDELAEAWAWMLEHEVAFEYPHRQDTQYLISYVNLEKSIEHRGASSACCATRFPGR